MTTDVIFRKEKSGFFKGDVYALFPHEVETYEGHVACYFHVGQHSFADCKYCIRTSVLATPDEYADLKTELEDRGYELNVIKKQNYDKYLKSYYEIKRYHTKKHV
jgi:hypothetical protein